ncbi:hypothetical protein KSP39_PZI014354 [Platanthera zijinensis]|uniref:Uncharacterized protein n=1 Tax=Platanthera zijinensis TaxID=2320716 RepID=A0AAP0BAF9_9ASPA
MRMIRSAGENKGAIRGEDEGERRLCRRTESLRREIQTIFPVETTSSQLFYTTSINPFSPTVSGNHIEIEAQAQAHIVVTWNDHYMSLKDRYLAL